jgi:hypothetical protein
MFYYGESNVPGAPGNLFAGGNFMGGPGSAIDPEAFKRDSRQQKIYNKGVRTDNPNEKDMFLRRTGPQLPFAYQGSMSFPIAQAYPGGQQVGNMAGMLGSPMQINPEAIQQMQGGMREVGQPPINFGVDIENERVKALRGNVNTQLDANQRLNFGGQYNVIDKSGQLGIGYQTPTFGFDVNVTRTAPFPGGSPVYGGSMNMGGRF